MKLNPRTAVMPWSDRFGTAGGGGGPVEPETGPVTQLPGARVRADEIAQSWIRTGLATGEADWPEFAAAIRECYRYAGLPWPGVVVPVPTPLVGALAAPLAANALTGRHTKLAPDLRREAVQENTRSALGSEEPRPIRQGPSDVAGVAGRAVRDAVGAAVLAAAGLGGALAGVPGAEPAGERSRAAARRTDAQVLVEQIERVRPRSSGDRDVAAATYDAVERVLRHGVHDKVVAAVERSVEAMVRPGFPAARAFAGGQWDVARCAWHELDRGAPDEALAGALRGVGWWWPHQRFVIVSDRPRELHLDGGRLHRTDGPALRWSDGWALYFLHGVQVSPDVILHPARISVADICAEPDIERRRIMIDRLGADRFIDGTGAEERHSDSLGVLWRIPHSPGNGRALQFIQVIRPTPDRSPGSYWLKTSPGASTAREAAHRSVELMVADAAKLV